MSKLMTMVALGAGLVLTAACGVSPSDPSELPSIGSQASIPTSGAASTAHTAGKRPGQILPPSPCGLGQELLLQIASRGRGYFDVSSNYQPADRSCAALGWQLGPGSAGRELATESISTERGEGLRVYPGSSSLRGVWVSASAPDGQVAKLYVEFNVGLSSGDETTSVAQTSRKRPGQIAPPTNCAMSEELVLQVSGRGKGHVEVSSNYRLADSGCPSLAWRFDPSAAQRELSGEPFSSRAGDAVRVFYGASSLRGAWVSASAPDGQSATIYVEFNLSASTEESD